MLPFCFEFLVIIPVLTLLVQFIGLNINEVWICLNEDIFVHQMEVDHWISVNWPLLTIRVVQIYYVI